MVPSPVESKAKNVSFVYCGASRLDSTSKKLQNMEKMGLISYQKHVIKKNKQISNK